MDRDSTILGLTRLIGQQAAKWQTFVDMDDLIQVGFLACLEKWPKYDPAKAKPTTFFRRIVLNAFRDYLVQQSLIRVPIQSLHDARHGKGKPATRERALMATGKYVSLNDGKISI